MTAARTINCYNCKHAINTEKHKEDCTTIYMFEVINTIIKPDTKKMMTFGLCGCAAIIIVFFTKDTNTPYQIIFGHHPIKKNILEWYNEYYNQDYNIVTIIKSPGNYVKIDNDKYFSLVTNDKDYWISNFNNPNNTLILEPYITDQCTNYVDFNSNLYLEISPELKYSNNYGKFIPLVPKL